MTDNQQDVLDKAAMTAEKTHQTAVVPTTYLHRLPAELRNRIYRYTGLKNARIPLATSDEPALAIAIPDLRDELHSIIFAENKLEIDVYSRFNAYNSTQVAARVASRGGRFGAGNLAIDGNSWVWKVNPEVITIDRILLDVQEMGGSKLLRCFLNIRIEKSGKRVVRVTIIESTQNRVDSREVGPMTALARARAHKLAERIGFVGFSLDDLRHIAAAFESVAAAKNKVKTCGKRVTSVEFGSLEPMR